jgi:hypothetical protein
MKKIKIKGARELRSPWLRGGSVFGGLGVRVSVARFVHAGEKQNEKN